MDALVSARRWVARRGQAGIILGYGMLFAGAGFRAFAVAGLGLAVMAVAAWAVLYDPDARDVPGQFSRRALTVMMWLGIIGSGLVAIYFLARSHAG